MTEKVMRHVRNRRGHLVVAAAILLVVGLGCDGERPEGSTPFTPEPTRVADITVNDMQVRVHNGAGWSQWETIADSMGAQVPEDEVMVLQFRWNGNVSSVAGFSWPELETCFIMPEHVEGNSSWRLTYGPGPEVWPGSGRIEFRSYETHVTQAPGQTLWFMAEMWDPDLQAYDAASPWFATRFTNVDPGVEFHKDEL